MSPFPEQRGPDRQEGALASYWAAVRAHPFVVILVVVVTVLASIGFLATRSERYEATADLLVNPLPQDDQVFFGLSLLRDSGDPVRTMQTAVALVESREAASAAAQELGDSWTTDRVLDAVELAPRGESNVLGITATATSAEEAADVANTFARSALEVRTEAIQSETQAAIERLDARVAGLPEGDPARGELTSRRDQLASAGEEGDPTLALSQRAIPPTSAVGAPPPVIVALAVLAGLVLGSGAAVLLELVARRIRDVDEGLDIYPLPVLTRVPEVSVRRLRGRAGATWHMPPEIREPFRTLALQFEQRNLSGHAIMITSATSGDGKTTSAINLAVSLAATGRDVTLLDFDLRNPQVGKALRASGGHPLSDVLDQEQSLDDLLYRASELSSLSVLPVLPAGEDAGLIDAAGLRLPRLLAEAKKASDYVVVDTAPLGEVGDALRLVLDVDDIMLMLRPGNTDRAHLGSVRELLEGVGYTPRGYIVLGRVEGSGRGYYSYGAAAQERVRHHPTKGEPIALEPVAPLEGEAESAPDTSERGSGN